jgi:hypothetical protein
MKTFQIIRGEFPFSDVVDVVHAETAEDALKQALSYFERNPDVFLRHCVVEEYEPMSLYAQ